MHLNVTVTKMNIKTPKDFERVAFRFINTGSSMSVTEQSMQKRE